MAEIELILSRPKERDARTSLFYEVLDTSVAKAHFACISEYKKNGFQIIDRECFFNFEPHESLAIISDQINERIEIINEYSFGAIRHRASPDMTQPHLNLLHHYFELFSSPILHPTAFFHSAPLAVKRALEEYNMLIHRFESKVRHECRLVAERSPLYNMVLEFEIPAKTPASFNRRPRYQLADEHYEHFDSHPPFGAWCINYCEVGKPIWDIYKDDDQIIGNESVRPLRYYSVDSFLQFCIHKPEEKAEELKQFWGWWDKNERRLKALKFEKYSKFNSIGYIPTAKLLTTRGDIAGFSNSQVIDWIKRHMFVEDVVAHC